VYDPDTEIPTRFEMSCYGQFMSVEQIAFIRTVAGNPDFKMTEEDALEGEQPRKAPPPTTTEAKSKCPVCGVTGASPSSDTNHAPWCKTGPNGSMRIDTRKGAK